MKKDYQQNSESHPSRSQSSYIVYILLFIFIQRLSLYSLAISLKRKRQPNVIATVDNLDNIKQRFSDPWQGTTHKKEARQKTFKALETKKS